MFIRIKRTDQNLRKCVFKGVRKFKSFLSNKSLRNRFICCRDNLSPISKNCFEKITFKVLKHASPFFPLERCITMSSISVYIFERRCETKFMTRHSENEKKKMKPKKSLKSRWGLYERESQMLMS